MFRPGDRVRKNPATWAPNRFDVWGRGVGVGVVIEPPFRMAEGGSRCAVGGGKVDGDSGTVGAGLLAI